MSLKTEAIKKFLKAAKSLANQGMTKESIMNFARNEFGEISELFQKQIDRIFKPKQGIQSVKMKDPDFDDTVVEMQFDEFGPFNPKNPLKNMSKQTKPMRYRGPDEFDTRKQYEEYLDAVLGPADEVFGNPLKDDLLKEFDKVKAKNVTPEKTKGKVKFRLNKERFKKDFNVTDEEVEKISLLNPEDQQKKVREYIDKDFKERIELSDYDITDLKPNAEGGRAEHYTGGMVDVEPNLSDIGHGSDALMARTRLLSPGAQGTTSTGLNYLLAEDNDNIRIPFSKGKLADKGRRKFMQLAGTGIGGLAALKAGLINLAKDAGPKVEMVRETVSKTPDYFFDLVSKIKMFGKEGRPLSERMNVTNYKNFELMEDVSTGDMRITKQAGDPDGPGYKEEVMEYSKGGNPMEEGVTVERYEEATLFPDMDGKMKDIEDGIEPDSIKEIMEEVSETITKKASGGLAHLLGE